MIKKRIWILVVARSGMIDKPELFDSYRKALSRKRAIEKRMNLDYDEVALFAGSLP